MTRHNSELTLEYTLMFDILLRETSDAVGAVLETGAEASSYTTLTDERIALKGTDSDKVACQEYEAEVRRGSAFRRCGTDSATGTGHGSSPGQAPATCAPAWSWPRAPDRLFDSRAACAAYDGTAPEADALP